MDCGSEALGFATFQCLSCGKGEHTVNFSCKGKTCPQCGKRIYLASPPIGVSRITRVADGYVRYYYQSHRSKQRDVFREVAGRNPLVCTFCGDDMELVRLYHPDRGIFYDIFAP